MDWGALGEWFRVLGLVLTTSPYVVLREPVRYPCQHAPGGERVIPQDLFPTAPTRGIAEWMAQRARDQLDAEMNKNRQLVGRFTITFGDHELRCPTEPICDIPVPPTLGGRCA